MKIDFLGVRQTPIFIWIQHGTINLSRPSKKNRGTGDGFRQQHWLKRRERINHVG
jgi:hypothetical protein